MKLLESYSHALEQNSQDRRRPTVFETFRWLALLVAGFWLCVAIGVWIIL